MLFYLKRVLIALLLLPPLIYATFTLSSRPLDPHPYFANGDFLVIAHRGGMGLAPENTLEAFARSAALGVDVLEMDLRQSKDGIPIILHDRRVNRTTNGRGRADSLNLRALRALDAGYHFKPDRQNYTQRNQGLKIPTLDEVLGAFPSMRFLIEIKDDSDHLALNLCQAIERFEVVDQVIAASFHDGSLATFRQACPKVATALSSGAGLSFTLLHWLRLDTAYHPTDQAFQFPLNLGGIRLVDRRFVDRAHAHNAQVHVWTVNDPATMRHLISIGVDGIITDYPDRLLQLLNRLPSEENQ